MKPTAIITQIAALGFMATLAEGAVLRYVQSGNWTDIQGVGGTNGWPSLPTIADEARINFGGNTVTVNTAGQIADQIKIGVDEPGNVIVAQNGVLTSDRDTRVGNNNSTLSTLVVQNGGIMNVGQILWTSRQEGGNAALGNITINSGGQINVGSHLWWGVAAASVVNISGTLNQTGGILGLGTSDAATASGGTATVNILNGGILALNNISGTGTNSIQAGSVIDISGSGQLSAPGDRTGSFTNYINANRITGNGMTGLSNLNIFYNSGMDLTIVTAVPEPASGILLGLAGSLAFVRRRR